MSSPESCPCINKTKVIHCNLCVSWGIWLDGFLFQTTISITVTCYPETIFKGSLEFNQRKVIRTLEILSESASVLEFIHTLVLPLSLSLDPQAILLQTCIQTLAYQKWDNPQSKDATSVSWWWCSWGVIAAQEFIHIKIPNIMIRWWEHAQNSLFVNVTQMLKMCIWKDWKRELLFCEF